MQIEKLNSKMKLFLTLLGSQIAVFLIFLRLFGFFLKFSGIFQIFLHKNTKNATKDNIDMAIIIIFKKFENFQTFPCNQIFQQKFRLVNPGVLGLLGLLEQISNYRILFFD